MNHVRTSVISWLIPGSLAKSFIPGSADFVVWQEAGIQSVVNLLEDYYKDVMQEERQRGFKVLHSPIPDMCAPSIEQLTVIVQWIDREIDDAKKVMVHCFAGIGRTGTILAAYLIYKGEGKESALEKVCRVGAGPQSQEQFEILEEFYIRCQITNNEKRETSISHDRKETI